MSSADNGGHAVMNRAIEALKSGQDVEAAAYEGKTAPQPVEDSLTEDTPEALAESVEGQEGTAIDEESHWYYNPEEGEETSETEEEGEELEETAELSEEESDDDDLSNVEEVSITDSKGRRKIKVDFNDRDKLKKYIQMAAGFRKMQAERDRLQAAASKSGELPSDVSEKLSSLDKLEDAWDGGGRQGIINVIDMLSKEQGGWGEFIKSEYENMRTREGASPAELERIELQERLEKESRAREKLLRQMEEREKRTNEQAELAERKELESTIHPVFEKYRFDGKLGDPETESSLDDAIWFKSLTQLEELPDNVELTAKVVDKVFRDVSERYRRMFKAETTKKVKQAVTKQKKAAGEKAAVKAMKGIKSTASQDEFRKQMKSGSWGDALASVLTGKVKL